MRESCDCLSGVGGNYSLLVATGRAIRGPALLLGPVLRRQEGQIPRRPVLIVARFAVKLARNLKFPIARDPDGVGKHWAACRFGNKRQEAAQRAFSPCMSPIRSYILNHMVQDTGTVLDASFAALSDATRRGVLEQLGRTDASITDLAEKFHMTLTGMKKHVGVLELAGLVRTQKVGRVRTCKLGPRRLEDETAWIERYRQLWAARFDELDQVVEELKRKEKADARKKR